jgi:transcriptional regulator with PAS, ATPase and Fis domain
MSISTFLGSIKDSVVYYGQIISKTVDADVIIVDNNFNVIAKTERYFNQYTMINLDTLIGKVIASQEKVIVSNKMEYPTCQKCKEIQKCQIVGFIGLPIYYDDRVIGAIALILPKHRVIPMFQEIDNSIEFVENLSEVLAGKIRDNKEFYELKQTLKEREILLDMLPDSVVFTDNNGVISYCNRIFKTSFGIEHDCIGEQIQNIISHKLISGFFETRYEFKNQKILIDLDYGSFYGFASCNVVHVKGAKAGALFIFKTINDILQDANSAGKGSLVTLQWLKDWLFTNEIFNQAKSLAVTDASVLIRGKSQNLNEILAKGICNYSNRSLRGLITVYCDNVYREFLERFLFDGFGELQRADGGTMLIQNIECLPSYLQKRLIKFLKNGEISYRNASHIKSNVRLLFSTTEDLLELVKKGLFLEELYYRISENVIEIPSLNDNKSLLQNIIYSGIEFYKNKHGKEEVFISHEATNFLCSYNWHEDIDKLETMLEQIVLRNTGTVLENDLHAMELLPNKIEPFMAISDIEKGKIEELLASGFNKTKISKLLGISRATLYRKIAEYNL